MLDQDVKITGTFEDARLDESGRRVPVIRVTFKVGAFGPFVEHFPKDGFSQLERDNKLNAFAREVRA